MMSDDAYAYITCISYASFIGVHIQENYGCHFYSKAVNAVRGLRVSYEELFKRYDVIVMPTIKYKPPVLPKAGLTVSGKNLHLHILKHFHLVLCVKH